MTVSIVASEASVLAPLGPEWRPVEPPTPLEIGGAFTAVRSASSGGGVLLVLCQATSPGALPARSARLRIRRRIEERVGEVVVVFTDSIQAATVWSLAPDPIAGVPAEFHLPGRESEVTAALRALVARRRGAGIPARDEALLAPVIVARLHGCPGGGVTIRELTAWAHRHASAGQAQRGWHALAGLTLLDPSCREGEWLEAAGRALLPLHIAILHRLRADADDLTGRDGPGRDPLRTIRPVMQAIHEYGGDVEAFARHTLCRRTLHGIADSPADARAARQRLAAFGHLPPGTTTPLDVRVKMMGPGASNRLDRPPAADHEGWVLEQARRLLEGHRAARPGSEPDFRRAALCVERRERRWASELITPWSDRSGGFDFERPR